MALENFIRLRPRPTLKPVYANLNSPSGPLSCCGQFIAKSKVKGIVFHFLIVKNVVDNLRSGGVASRMGLITTLDVVSEGVGCLRTDPLKIVLKYDADISLTVAHRVPIPPLPPCSIMHSYTRHMKRHTDDSNQCTCIQPDTYCRAPPPRVACESTRQYYCSAIIVH